VSREHEQPSRDQQDDQQRRKPLNRWTGHED
jgi:hypothetical protein